ncbi:MAG TPA: glycosyltransferase [Acidimicrobiales bacterium]|nr:glycosyltransferase [Acidimicrobiales bacterium]
MRIAYWSPFPPQRTGIADYSYELLEELRELLDVVAVVDDRQLGRVRVPEGVDLAGASCPPEGIDLDVYQMGNNPPFHAFVHRRALEVPGLLVLHDPSLVDFYAAIAGGASHLDGAVFRHEVQYNCPEIGPDDPLPLVVDGEHRDVDRLRLLCSRRVVEASLRTLVHSTWVRDLLRERFPGADVERICLAAPLVHEPEDPGPRREPILFGVFGGITYYKRLVEVSTAFAEAHRRDPRMRMVIAGRADEARIEEAVRSIAAEPSLAGSLEVRTDLPLRELEQLIVRCDIAVSLRWPTAGEMSATLLRALGAGKPVIVSDLPQFGDLDASFCWRVPIEPRAERACLVEVMTSLAASPDRLRAASQAARAYVARHATYRVVANEYVRHIEACARRPARGRRATPLLAICGAREGGVEPRRLARAASERGIGAIAFGPAASRRIAGDEGPLSSIVPGLRAVVWCADLDAVEPPEVHRPAGTCLVASVQWSFPFLSRRLGAWAGRFDEIWLPSRFAAQAFVRHAARVAVVPPAVDLPVSDDGVLGRVGWPERRVVFLSFLDARTGFARKNPLGLVEAFRRAFTRAERRTKVGLVVSTANLASSNAAGTVLREAVEGVGGVLIDRALTQSELAGLLTACDVYASLHRSVGFGAAMAAAMLAGKPVVATGYSGNLEYLSSANALLCRYRICEVVPDELVFEPTSVARRHSDGYYWAEPDLDHAASLLRALYDDAELRSHLGSVAREVVRRRFSPEASGAAIRRRLDAIAASRPRVDVANRCSVARGCLA